MADIKVIAEIASAHGGDKTSLMTLLEKAHQTGADFVKIQVFNFTELVHLTEGETSDLEQIEISINDWLEVLSFAESKNINLLAEVYDLPSLQILKNKSSIVGFKIPTADINNSELIKEVAKEAKPVFIGIGGAKIYEIEESIKELERKYQKNNQLAEQIFDSEYFEIFENICSSKQNSPNFVVSILCSTITNLERKGLDSKLLESEQIMKTFELLEQNKINKESIEIIFEQIMSKKADNVLQALEKASITQLTDEELDKILDEIIQKNIEKVNEEQMRALSGLMGIAMKQVRGKASGKIINQKLKDKIKF